LENESCCLLRQIIRKTLSAGEVAQGVGPEFKHQYHKKIKIKAVPCFFSWSKHTKATKCVKGTWKFTKLCPFLIWEEKNQS
jgi:hypothetical protein